MSNITDEEIEELAEILMQSESLPASVMIIKQFLEATLQNKVSEECTHESLIDTGIGYYHCPACNKGWTYSEWEEENKKR